MTPQEADFLICGPNSYFSDDKKTTCFTCRAPIFYRPHAPIPKRGYACMPCALKQIEKEGIPVEMAVTKETLEEIHELGGKDHGNTK